MSAKRKKGDRRIINLGGKYNRKIVQSELHPGQYHDIEDGYAKYNENWENPRVGPPIQAASDEAIKKYFRNKERGTGSSSVRKVIK